MKPIAAITSIFTTSILFTSCIKTDYYNTNPSNPHPTYYNTWDEEFYNDNYGWSFTNSRDSSYGDVAGGTYELVNYSRTLGQMVTVNTGASLQYDFSIQTKVQTTNAFGLVFGASNYDFGYAFYIDNEGYFALYKEGSSKEAPSLLVGWTLSNNAIKGGYNNLEIDQVGSYWYGYINDVQVFKIPSQYLKGDQVGFRAYPNTMGYADYLTVKW